MHIEMYLQYPALESEEEDVIINRNLCLIIMSLGTAGKGVTHRRKEEHGMNLRKRGFGKTERGVQNLKKWKCQREKKKNHQYSV
jgi:hypothetical protein